MSVNARRPGKHMLTIAQITDLHIAPESDALKHARNVGRLRAAIRSIASLTPKPAAIVATGDLTDTGTAEEFQTLDAILQEAGIPVYLGIGNHDRRAPFRQVFPGTPIDANGHIQYTADLGGLTLIMLDTVEEGRVGGAFGERRASWLRQALRVHRKEPTLIALHHPPVASGIRRLDPEPGAQWVPELAAALDGHRQIQGLIAGHVHRAFHARFAGHIVSVSGSTAPELTLDLSPGATREPDEIIEEPPGYTLLMWDEGKFVVHNCVAS
jgi:3',5'-cyclic AMP phosphodiesterase CpdA